MSEKKKVDWDAMEPEWRAGIIEKKQLSEKYGVSRAAIDKHWDKLGIPRDLTQKIRLEAEALVAREAVTREVTQTRLHVTERDIVNKNARTQADLLISHRTDIPRYQKLAAALLAELEAQTGNKELFDHLAELLQAPDEKGLDKLNDIYRKVIATPQRIDSFKKLAETYKILIGLERQAFGISDNANGEADKPHVVQVTKDMTPQDAARAYADMMKGK